MKNMIADGYQDAKTLQRRIEKVEAWLANPNLLEADKGCRVRRRDRDRSGRHQGADRLPARTIPDDAKFLSEVAGTKIDEAFIGSCMTNIGHFRAAAEAAGRPARYSRQAVGGTAHQDGPERADQGRPLRRLRHGRCPYRNARLLAVHGQPGPGARRCDGDFTSTRNFPNRLGKNTNVFLGSAELAAIASRLGKLPTKEEYLQEMGVIDADKASVYRYMNFDQIEEYAAVAKGVTA